MVISPNLPSPCGNFESVSWVCLVLPSTARTLVPVKSMRAPRKTTPPQAYALFRVVRQDRFISARAFTARMRNLYGMRAGWKTTNNQLVSRGYHAYRPTRKPLLTANHHRLHLKWAQRWQNLTMAHWQHAIFSDESRFQLYPVYGRLRVHRLTGERFQQRYQAFRVQAGGGLVHVWGAFHSGAKSPLVLLTDISLVSSTWAFCQTP